MAHVVTEEDLKMLDEMVARGHEAQKYMMTLDQQQIDRLVQAVAASVCDATVWAKLADEAVDETRLGDKVTKVTLSTRLKSHPVCLSSEGPISIEMERVLKGMPGGEAPKSEKVLELNPSHPVFETMKSLQASGDTEKLNAYADILYNQARLIEGLPVEDAVAYTEAVCKLMK